MSLGGNHKYDAGCLLSAGHKGQKEAVRRMRTRKGRSLAITIAALTVGAGCLWGDEQEALRLLQDGDPIPRVH